MARAVILPPNVLLTARLLALWLLVHRGPVWVPESHLPFLLLFDRMGPATGAMEVAMAVAFPVCIAALFLNRAPRLSSFVLGVLVLAGIAMSRTTYSNNLVLAGFLLILVGLYEPGWGTGPIRAQLAVVYLGAGLNKLLDAAWRTGVFMEYWTVDILGLDRLRVLADLLPAGALFAALGWGVIVAELGLAAGFARRGWTPWAIGVGLTFHVGMLVFTRGELSWLFLYVMGAGYLAVAPWPAPDARRETAGGSAGGLRGLAVRPWVYVGVALLLLWQPLPAFLRRVAGLVGIG